MGIRIYKKSDQASGSFNNGEILEICSFVLKGKINHYDTQQNKWIPLEQGDIQVIRSGSGISHSEEICDSSEIFQIWFDPDLSKTLTKEATFYKND